jgi:hypothetical protein
MMCGAMGSEEVIARFFKPDFENPNSVVATRFYTGQWRLR